ncbi:MAG TPA: ribonuclease H-like domain-containing protein [Desulfomonilaceae bacterium]|nr:ribonuclease H-like domain-containing protein [Desulfomonilaceae bacterium]
MLSADNISLSKTSHFTLKMRVQESMENLDGRNPVFFGQRLHSADQWRLFPDFRESVAYLDIETNGRPGAESSITTIALYDGNRLFHYVKGRNLHQFPRDIAKYTVVVTYNGKCFDVPVIESFFGIKMPHAHIDLRYVLKSVGCTGGLKGCEKKLGLDREDLDGVDGYYAVLLWKDFKINRNEKALETLLAYNTLDAVNLEHLLVLACNMKLQDTPFSHTHRLALPPPFANPFKAHKETIYEIRDLYGLW